MIRCLFILLKKVNLMKWPFQTIQVSLAFQRWLTDLGKKQSFNVHERKACCFKVLCKTLLFAVQCSSLYWPIVFQKSVAWPWLCQYLNEPIAWVWGRTICFHQTIMANSKKKYFFIWDCLFGTTKFTLYPSLHLLLNIQTSNQLDVKKIFSKLIILHLFLTQSYCVDLRDLEYSAWAI